MTFNSYKKVVYRQKLILEMIAQFVLSVIKYIQRSLKIRPAIFDVPIIVILRIGVNCNIVEDFS